MLFHVMVRGINAKYETISLKNGQEMNCPAQRGRFNSKNNKKLATGLN